MENDVFSLKKSQIVPSGWNPRTEEDKAEFALLKQSIDALGIRVPLIVLPKRKDGKYRLIAGERRWKAAKPDMLIPCVIQKEDELDAKLTALVENLVRESVGDADHEKFISALFLEGRSMERWADQKGMSAKTGIPLWLIQQASVTCASRKELALPEAVNKHVTSGDLMESSSVKDTVIRRKLLTMRSKVKQGADNILKGEGHVVQHVSEKVRGLPTKVALKYLDGEVSDVALEHARSALSQKVPEEKVLYELDMNAMQRKHTEDSKKWIDTETEDRLLKGRERNVLVIGTAKDKVKLKKYANAMELVRKMSAIDLDAMKDPGVKNEAIEDIRYMITALSTILLQIGQSVPYVRKDVTGKLVESGDET